jgi:hypothetical protein
MKTTNVRNLLLMAIMAIAITSLSGCGIKERSASAAETTVTPTVIPSPAASGADSELSPLEKKYQYYDKYYDEENFSYALSGKNIEDIEDTLSHIGWYRKWTNLADDSISKINEITMSGQKYGVKDVVCFGNSYIIYYYYINDPDLVYRQCFYANKDIDQYTLSDNIGNTYANMSIEQYDLYYTCRYDSDDDKK